MTRTEAELVVARLFAAFPDRARGDDTRQVYVEHVMDLRDFDVARAVSVELERSSDWLPSIAAFRETYNSYRRNHPQPALPEPALTDAERAANVRRAQAMTDMIAGKIDMDTALERLDGEGQ